MNCPNFVLDQDGERVCECGDEGRLCADCYHAEAVYWRAMYLTATQAERDPEECERQMREAGRGHLLP
jgi:hypothetical protein